METGFLVLESGETFKGRFLGVNEKAGEVVFNTSHTGYEEMATDPSYFSQILVLTATMQGNYGIENDVWESRKPWIHGFVCLEMQDGGRDQSWLDRLRENNIPVIDEVDTRRLTLRLRSGGVVWGAIVKAESEAEAIEKSKGLIAEAKDVDPDWPNIVSRQEKEVLKGENESGPRVAILDFGCKENIIRELRARCAEVALFPVRSSASEILDWKPDGVMLSNGPGDPSLVEKAVDTVKDLLGHQYVFGICMGHQILSQALGGKTYKLKFGHRGSNHPVKDLVLDKIYMTSQNHGYAVDPDSLPSGVQVSHINLNDQTVSGINYPEKNCMSVQFHPESHPGPRDSANLFKYFVDQLR